MHVHTQALRQIQEKRKKNSQLPKHNEILANRENIQNLDLGEVHRTMLTNGLCTIFVNGSVYAAGQGSIHAACVLDSRLVQSNRLACNWQLMFTLLIAPSEVDQPPNRRRGVVYGDVGYNTSFHLACGKDAKD